MKGSTCVKYVAIGAEQATELLKRNKGNRRPRLTTVATYAAEMVKGRWGKCPQPIIVAEDGTLLDGQHRLLAVVEAAKANPKLKIQVSVVVGVPRDAFAFIDQQLSRTPADLLCTGTKLPRSMPSILRAMIAYNRPVGSGRKILNSRMQTLFAKYGSVATWASELGPVRAPTTTPVLAVIARARFKGAPVGVLEEFYSIMREGVPVRGSKSANTPLRLARVVYAAGPGGGSRAFELTAKAERAVYAYLHGVELTRIDRAAENLFPLDGECM